MPRGATGLGFVKLNKSRNKQKFNSILFPLNYLVVPALSAKLRGKSKGMVLEFPEHFFWGTSTAAAQVETASEHNWKGVESRDGFFFDRTTDHELRREEDLTYIQQFGSVYRCGVDWARLQNAPFAPFEPSVVEEYQEFFANLSDANMRVLLVLHHFTNPLWFEEKGGWLYRENIPAFIDYAQQCIEYFGEYIFNWNTFNEPNVYALNGYLLGNFPPFQKNYFKANRVLKNMGRAHRVLYKMLKANDPNKPVGISFNTCYFQGFNAVGKLIAGFTDWWFHRWSARFFKKYLDYWGLSYYAYIPFRPMAITEIDTPGRLAQMNIPHDKMWGYRPEGLARNLEYFHKRYKKPIVITENGICTDDDSQRIQAIKDYLAVCHEAISKGVRLRGYIHWSTWDNFEWNLGPTYRFGLVRINLETFDRQMTRAGEFYRKVCQDNAIDISPSNY